MLTLSHLLKHFLHISAIDFCLKSKDISTIVSFISSRQFYSVPQILSSSFISFLHLLVGLQLLNTFTSLLPGLCLLAFHLL